MNLITDTFIEKRHFREVLTEPDETEYFAFQCAPKELSFYAHSAKRVGKTTR